MEESISEERGLSRKRSFARFYEMQEVRGLISKTQRIFVEIERWKSGVATVASAYRQQSMAGSLFAKVRLLLLPLGVSSLEDERERKKEEDMYVVLATSNKEKILWTLFVGFDPSLSLFVSFPVFPLGVLSYHSLHTTQDESIPAGSNGPGCYNTRSFAKATFLSLSLILVLFLPLVPAVSVITLSLVFTALCTVTDMVEDDCARRSKSS